MHQAIPHLSFADWVLFVFDHPAEGPSENASNFISTRFIF